MILTVHVQPNAKVTEIVKWLDADTVKIKIAAPATVGKANQALIEFLSKHFGLPKSRIELVRGASARLKQINIPDR